MFKLLVRKEWGLVMVASLAMAIFTFHNRRIEHIAVIGRALQFGGMFLCWDVTLDHQNIVSGTKAISNSGFTLITNPPISRAQSEFVLILAFRRVECLGELMLAIGRSPAVHLEQFPLRLAQTGCDVDRRLKTGRRISNGHFLGHGGV